MDGFQVNQFPANFPAVQNWQQIPNAIPGNALPKSSFQKDLDKAQEEIFSLYNSENEENISVQYEPEYPLKNINSPSVQKYNTNFDSKQDYINFKSSPVYAVNPNHPVKNATELTQPDTQNNNIDQTQTSEDYYKKETSHDYLIEKKQYAIEKPRNSTYNKKHINENPLLKEQIRMYKEDQLMANPGGDYYVQDKNGQMQYNPDFDNSNFVNRVGKDISDSIGNIKNAVANLTAGTKYSYIDKEGKIQTAQKTGLLKTIGNFAKNFFDAVTFGSHKENPPQNIMQKAGYSAKKLMIDGVVKDILIGIPHSMVNTGENLLLATLNAMETVPDATVGNFKTGEKITTSVFDNGQIAVNYITDVMPTGEAWMRVNAFGSEDSGLRIPILYNLKTPQQGLEDMRWATVRNTPFRKVIETVGSMLSQMLKFAAM